MGTTLPLPKRGGTPKFSAHVYCGQTAGWMKPVLGMEVRLRPGDFVLDRDPVPFPQKRAEPPSQFSAHFYRGQTARCIKMPLGMDLGLSPGDFVLHGDPVFPPHQRGRSPPPNFRPISIVTKRLDASRCHWLWRQASAQAVCVRWGPSPPPKRGAEPPPHFQGLRLEFRNFEQQTILVKTRSESV